MRVRGRWLALIAIALVAVVTLVWWLGRGASRSERGASAGGARSGTQVAQGTGWNARGRAATDGRRVAGIVVDDVGAPLTGAVVRIASTRLAARTTAAPSTTTPAGGAFDLGLQPAEVVIVTAELAGRTAAIAQIDLTNPLVSPAPDRLRLVLHACTAAIHGTVYDMAEGTVAGATLSLVEDGVRSGVSAVADGNGAFDLCVPVGEANVIIAADGYGTLVERVAVYGRTRRDFRIAPGAVVTGQVVRASDKSPVSGAEVEIRALSGGSSTPPLVATSASDGRFEITGVTTGRHLILATADHLATLDPLAISPEVGLPNEVTVELPAAWTMSGRIVTSGAKTSAAGVRVWAMNQERFGFDRFRSLRATSQEDGSFVLESVPDGRYRVFLDNTEHDGPIVVKGADVTGLELETAASASVSGRVLAEGKPVDGVEVRIGEKFATSDGEGRYTVRGLDAGTHEIYAQSNRIGAFTRDMSVTIAAGEAKTGVDISLDLAGSIEGVVVDQDGKPLPGVMVKFSLIHGQDFGTATSADDGSFRAGALSGGGDYIYEVHQRDEESPVLPPVSGKRFPPVAVKDGTTHVTGLRIQVRYERLAITGRVVDSSGKPVVDATVRALPASTVGWYRVPPTMTDDSGAFTLRDLAAGAYGLNASGAHAEGHLSQVAAGSRNVVIRAAAHGGIDGTLKGFSTTPIVTVTPFNESYELRRATVTGTTFTVRDLPPGTYSVVARVGTEVSRTAVEVTPAQNASVTIGPAEYGTIAGTVVDGQTRAPIDRARCTANGALDEAPDDTGMTSETIVFTNSAGQFEIEHVLTGAAAVVCRTKSAMAWASTTVVAGRVARVELIANAPRAETPRPQSGLTLENQLSDVVVDAVAPDSAAAKAGVQRGDILVRIGDRPVGPYMAEAAIWIIEEEAGTVSLALERDDKPLSVTLKLAAPAP